MPWVFAVVAAMLVILYITINTFKNVPVENNNLVISSESGISSSSTEMKTTPTIFDFISDMKDISTGETFDIEQARDNIRKKLLLVVNVASKWGLTKSNYQELQQLHEKYEKQGLVVIGIPCNSFKHQEPASNQEIAAFTKSLGVSFSIFEKVEPACVGKDSHPLFKFLTHTRKKKDEEEDAHPPPTGKKKEKEEEEEEDVGDLRWNFEKFLVRDGVVCKRYGPRVSPLSFERDVEALLDQL